MDLGLNKKVALVTASSRGIGLGVAKVLAAEGARVVITSRNGADLEAARSLIQKEVNGADVLALPADMTRPNDLKRLVERVNAETGGIDILVYNAGPPKPGTFGELTYADWEEGTNLLLLSAVALVQQVIPHMKERKWGRLIFITSFTLKNPQPNLLLSNTVRLSTAGLSRSLATEFGRLGTTSNVVIQGHIRTDRTIQLAKDAAARTGKPVDQIIGDLERQIPLGRYGTPEEVGYLVSFIASEKGAYLNGSALTIDGGFVDSVF